MKCCVSTNVGTWTNWLTFEPDPDYSPDAATELLSPISYGAATRNFITSGQSHVYLQRREILKWFYLPRAVGTTLSEVHALYRVHFYSVSQKKPGSLQLISHNFTNSQRSLIIFGTKIPYSILTGFHNNSGDLTHLNSGFLGWLRTTYYRQDNKRVAKKLWDCVNTER